MDRALYTLAPITGSSGGGYVPWGSSLGLPAVKAHTAGPNGIQLSWTC